MIDSIDHFSINDNFWIQFKSHLISFGFKRLPKDIHFTIGFDQSSPDANIHLTKNHSDPKDKPKIKLIIIDKKVLEEITPSLFTSILNYILRPLEMRQIQKEMKGEIGFISFDKRQNSEIKIESKLIELFKGHHEIKNSSFAP